MARRPYGMKACCPSTSPRPKSPRPALNSAITMTSFSARSLCPRVARLLPLHALGFALLLSGAPRAGAQASHDLPAYQPAPKISGTIRAFGTSLAGLMKSWEEGFAKYQPEIRFDDKYPSGDVWPAG